MTYELRLLSSIRGVDQAQWDALVGPDDSPFVEWAWLDALEEAECVGAEAGWLPCHVAVTRGGELVAAAPCYLKTNSEGEFIFDWSWADLAQRLRVPYYPKLVVAVPFTPATGARVLTAQGEDRRALVATVAHALVEVSEEVKARSVHALFVTEDEAKVWASVGYAHRHSIQYHWQNRGFSTFEDFLATLPSKKRTQLRREAKQPAKDGVTIARLEPHEYTTEMAHTMFALYLTTIDKFSWGRQYLTSRFFEIVAERFRDRLAWVVAHKDDAVLAGAFNVEKGKRLYGRYWGTTVEMPFLHFNVCYYEGIRECIARGLDVFEPGAGGEHKRVRGFAPTIMHSAHYLADQRLAGIIVPHIEREREAIAAHLASGGGDDE